jgi:hypothetical protein
MTSSQTIEVYWGDPQVFKGEILYFEVSEQIYIISYNGVCPLGVA